MAEVISWSEVEQRLGELPHWAISSFGVRAARRYFPQILACEPQYGAEVLEWLIATDASLRMVERFASRQQVSRFTLDLAAEIARATATAAAQATQRQGPSNEAHLAELAFAAAALAADSARTPNLKRAASLATQAARATTNGLPIHQDQLDDLQALREGEPLLPLTSGEEGEALKASLQRLAQGDSPLLKPAAG